MGKAFPPAPTAWGAPLSAGAPATPRLRTGRCSLTDSPGRAKPSSRSKLSDRLPLPEAVIPCSSVALPPPLSSATRYGSTPLRPTKQPLPLAPPGRCGLESFGRPPTLPQSLPDRPPLPGAVQPWSRPLKPGGPLPLPHARTAPFLPSRGLRPFRFQFSDRLRRGTPARVKAAHRA